MCSAKIKSTKNDECVSTCVRARPCVHCACECMSTGGVLRRPTEGECWVNECKCVCVCGRVCDMRVSVCAQLFGELWLCEGANSMIKKWQAIWLRIGKNAKHFCNIVRAERARAIRCALTHSQFDSAPSQFNPCICYFLCSHSVNRPTKTLPNVKSRRANVKQYQHISPRIRENLFWPCHRRRRPVLPYHIIIAHFRFFFSFFRIKKILNINVSLANSETKRHSFGGMFVEVKNWLHFCCAFAWDKQKRERILVCDACVCEVKSHSIVCFLVSAVPINCKLFHVNRFYPLSPLFLFSTPHPASSFTLPHSQMTSRALFQCVLHEKKLQFSVQLGFCAEEDAMEMRKSSLERWKTTLDE